MTAPLVLVCDDTKNIAQSIVIMLQAEGYRGLAVTSALEAVSLARKEKPSLILMDIMMPGMDGSTAAEAMRDHDELQGIPIVLLSALPEDEVRTRAEECGAKGFLTKPFTKQSLLGAVARHVPAPGMNPQKA
jgi:CheY-like chemotaxis protein